MPIDRPKVETTVFAVLGAASFCHLLNDLMQSVFVAAYPIFKGGFDLNFGQIGLLTLTYQITASLLQPIIGIYTDRKPLPYSLPFGMVFSLAGYLVLAFAQHYVMLLAGGALLGMGSSIFHPESSRLARLASGGAHGLAQSLFQVGGNIGTALGPLLVAFFIIPRGQTSLAYLALAALGGMIVLTGLAHWYKSRGQSRRHALGPTTGNSGLSRRQVRNAVAVLVALMLSKYFYLASFSSYYIFYLMQHSGLSAQTGQLYLFVFLAAVAIGTLIGGPVGDRIGRKKVIWGSILGILPFTLALPHVNLTATVALSVIIGLVLASAFSAIVVYAQDLMPGRVGMVSGLFFGLSFGMGGLGAALLGELADWTSIGFVYEVCSFLPLIGLLAALLPDVDHKPMRLRARRPQRSQTIRAAE